MENELQFTPPKREYLEETIDPRLQSYIDELSNDTRLNEMNIKEKSLNRAYIGSKWCTYSYQEENFLKKLKKQLEDYKTVNMDRLQTACEQKGVGQSKLNLSRIKFNEILMQQPEYINLQKQIETQEQIIRFIAEAKQIIASMGFDISNSKELLKLEMI